MLNVCVCVVSLSQPSSRDLLMLNICVCVVSLSQPSRSEMFVCVLSCCLSPVVEIRDVKCLCVCCLVVSAQ